MVIFSEIVEFRWFLAMDPITIFDSNCRKYVLFDKQISKFAFGDDFELIKPHHRER